MEIVKKCIRWYFKAFSEAYKKVKAIDIIEYIKIS